MQTLTAVEPLPLDALDLPPEEVARRFRLAMELGRPRWLWPEMPVPHWRASLHAIQQVLRERLARPDHPARLGVPYGPRPLGVAAFTSGTGALLGYWAEAGLLRTHPEAEALLRLHLAHGRARAERREAILDDVLERLHRAGVEPVLVKGMHTAAALFPEPGTRPMSDIDLVLRPEQATRAEQALASGGYLQQRSARVESPFHADWTPPGASLRIPSLELEHVGSPLSVNLRGGFVFPVFGRRRIDLGEPSDADLRPWTDPGARVLHDAWLIAYLAVHASRFRTNLTLVRMVELVLAARAGIDWSRLLTLLEGSGAAPFAYPALALAERLAPGSFPILRELERSALPRHRRMFATAWPADVQPAGDWELSDYVFWSSGPRQTLAAIMAVALPPAPIRDWPGVWMRRARLAWARATRLSLRPGQG